MIFNITMRNCRICLTSLVSRNYSASGNLVNVQKDDATGELMHNNKKFIIINNEYTIYSLIIKFYWLYRNKFIEVNLRN